MIWKVPKIWDQAECVILGGGPSLSAVPFDRLRDWRSAAERRHVIAVNMAYKTGKWDVIFFGDTKWFEWNEENLRDWGGLIVTWRNQYENRSWVRVAKCDHRAGLSSVPGVLTWNFSSGACAMSLAICLGAKRVVLLGFDGQPVNGKRNFHNEYGYHKEAIPNDKHWKQIYPSGYSALASKLPAHGVEVLNATPGTVIDAFPVVSIEEALFSNTMAEAA